MTHDLTVAMEWLEQAKTLLERQRTRVKAKAYPSRESVRLLREMERAMWGFEKHVTMLEREWLDTAPARTKRTRRT
jgi:hypothetical protein